MKMIDHNHFYAILFWGHLLNIPMLGMELALSV